MSRTSLWILLSLLVGAQAATGQSSCLPGYTALQTIVKVDPLIVGSQFKRQLISERADGYFLTKVQLEGQMGSGKSPGLKLSVRFDPNFDGVSLPYNLYAVMVVKDGEVLLWRDFTGGCKSSGVGFFPGAVIDAGTVKLNSDQLQSVQIMVWGRL